MSSPSTLERAGIDLEAIEHLDREQVFLLYANFCGDVVRTAAALNISPVAVLRMADDEGWAKKLEPIIALSRSNRPGDFERAVNRAINFVQAHRLRLILERTLKRMTGYSDAELEALLTEDKFSKDGEKLGSKLSTRALADYAAAMEKVHAMTYASLNDSAQERAKRKHVEDEGDSTQDIHAKLAEAMSKAGMSKAPRAILFDAQVAQGEATAQQAACQAKAKVNPLDNDEH
jgi:hypothetical protein